MPAKKYRVLFPFRWVDPRTGASTEFYEVGRVVSGQDVPELEKHLAGIDDKGPLLAEDFSLPVEEPAPASSARASSKEK